MADTHIKIKPVTPRVQYTANGSTTVFPYSFAIFDETDMVVYVDDAIITTGYTVSGAGQTDGGEVTFDSAPVDGTIITLLRNVPIERMTDFQEGGTFRPKNINDEFDRQTAFAQQVQEALSRCVKVDPTSESNPEEILPKVERLYDSADNIDIVANDKANVDAVAGNQTNIDAVAGNAGNINTVAGIASDVSTVAGNTTDISNVATNMSDVNDCATNMDAIQDAPNQAQSAADSAELAYQYGNDKINQTHISNCITSIPQDIKLELNNGTLTLKAGSKVYVPNGAGVFDTLIINSDLTYTYTTNEQATICVKSDGSELFARKTTNCTSGSGATATAGYAYDTTTNKINWYNISGQKQSGDYSLPICLITTTDGVISNIDQVFNGFGYIGSTVFALPGVKGLIPNGRNEDGTLKSIEFLNDSVKVFTKTDNVADEWLFEPSAQIKMRGWGSINVHFCVEQPVKTAYHWSYVPSENQWWYYTSSSVLQKAYPLFFGKDTSPTTTVSGFSTKTVFHAVDYSDAVKYSDKETIVGWGIPDYSAGVAYSSSFTAPSNGYCKAQGGVTAWGTLQLISDGNIVDESHNNTNGTNILRFVRGYVKKGSVVNLGGYTNFGNIVFYPLFGG